MDGVRPSERDMMGGIERPDLRCADHGRLEAILAEVELMVCRLGELVRELEEKGQ